MPVFRLGSEVAFPHPDESAPSGLLAVGGDLSPERLLLAYSVGIFPWYSEDQPILWHSPDPYQDGQLVGGLYGVSLGSVFFGESMFARVPDASKAAFATLVPQLERWGFDLIDCQQHTHHLARFGAVLWPRRRYLEALARGVARETRRGVWRFSEECR